MQIINPFLQRCKLMLEQLYQFERLQSTMTCLLLLKDRRILRPSDVCMTAPVSYFSSGPLEARDSIRVHGQWRLEVLAPA